MSTSPERRVLRGHPAVRLPTMTLAAVEPVRRRTTLEEHHAAEAEAAARVEAARQEAAVAGHAEGYARGYAEGLAESRATFAGLLGQLDAQAARLQQREAQAFAELAAAATTVATALVEVLLDRELALSASPGLDALARALRAAPEAGDVVARLNREDLELLGDVADLAPGRTVDLVADPGIGRGSCVLDVGDTRVDARLDAALQRVREELAK
jgi:flagellar assembly protein FliH